MAERLPDVSVVIPSKDRPRLVRHAIASALAQTGVTLEVIVIDDGSTPALDLGASDARVRVLRNEQPGGVARARNQGVDAARGPWVAFLDDDDVWAPGKLAAQIDAMRRHGSRWSTTGTIWLDEARRVRWITAPPAPPVGLPELRASNAIGTPSGVVAERSLVREAGGFDPAFSVFADWDMWLRMAAIAPAWTVPEPLLGYVVHGSSMHRDRPRAVAAELAQLGTRHRDLVTGPIDPAQTELWIARGQRDAGHRRAGARQILAWGRRHRMRRALWVLLAVPLADRLVPSRRVGARPTPAWARGLSDGGV